MRKMLKLLCLMSLLTGKGFDRAIVPPLLFLIPLRYDLPSLKDATEEKHKAAGRRVASKEEMDEYLGAYRVISSRWSTGVCNTCQEKMEAGMTSFRCR